MKKTSPYTIKKNSSAKKTFAIKNDSSQNGLIFVPRSV